MKKTSIVILFLISGLFAQEYCAGEQISLSHQNEEHVVGAGYDNYESGDIFKLADWNGDLNGGQYHVIFIDMSNSW
tara:strand:- start:66 stop:293 length:228 start_codon:yes stop_codon:yes gene_type:complete